MIYQIQFLHELKIRGILETVMALFGRNNDEDSEYEDEEDLIEEERKDRKLIRKFKDLNPKNKKKRKEPPKPWGKRERLIVVVVLLSTIIISVVLILTSGGQKLSPLNLTFPKLDFSSLNPFKEETIIIQKK